jgi:hypothetical protein
MELKNKLSIFEDLRIKKYKSIKKKRYGLLISFNKEKKNLSALLSNTKIPIKIYTYYFRKRKIIKLAGIKHDKLGTYYVKKIFNSRAYIKKSTLYQQLLVYK